MSEHQSSRTLVKSTPELWAECSDAASLARHLGAFGEIRITKLEPESAVAWEGTAASGTVTLEPSGWGTRVTLTVTEEALSDDPDPEPVAVEPEPVAQEPEPAAAEAPAETVPVPRPGVFARFRLAFRRRPEPVAEPEPVLETPPEPEPAAEPEPALEALPEPEPAAEPETPPEPAPPPGEAALVAALDSLGMAHHRPYSRA
jgi:hypothetical protein